MREFEPDVDPLLYDLKSKIGAAADKCDRNCRPGLVIRMPSPRGPDIRFLPKEVAAQSRDLIREEPCAEHVRDF